MDQLIAKRQVSLDEVEQIVSEARQKVEEGDDAGDRRYRQLVAQGPELLHRVAEARKLYVDLQNIAASEKIVRLGTK